MSTPQESFDDVMRRLRETPLEVVRPEWEPRSMGLSDEELDHIPEPSIAGLAYPGHYHLISGKPEALKSWTALHIGLDAIRQGGKLLVVDVDGNGLTTLARRVRQLGASPLERAARSFYLEDMTAWSRTEDSTVAEWVDKQIDSGPVVVAIDTVNPAAASLGLTLDEEGWSLFEHRVVKPLKFAGAALLGMDHLPKSKEADQDYSIGSQRKHGSADVHLRLELVGEPFQRGPSEALVRVRGMKDRPTGHKRTGVQKLIGTLAFRADADDRVSVELSSEDPSRPTELMDRILEWATGQKAMGGEPWSGKNVREARLGRRDETVLRALKVLVDEGRIANGKEGYRLA